MKVEIMEVAGIDAALYGLGLSHGATSNKSYINFSTEADYGIQNLIDAKRLNKKMQDRAEKNAHLGLGHNKYLESCMVWMKVTAPRFFWSEMDTYRLMTKQSDSTMHTLLKNCKSQDIVEFLWKELEESDVYKRQKFSLIETEINSLFESFKRIAELLDDYEDMFSEIEKLQVLKNCLPEAWQQTRVLCVSYKTLQNIYAQRKNHRLYQWRQFCNELKQLPHSNWITGE